MFRYSVRKVLDFEGFRRVEPLVVAGHQYLDRLIRWVHISDLPHAAHVLRGGELLLTTGVNLGESADEHRRYIRDLVEHGVAAVAFDFHPVHRTCPDSLILISEQCQLPLIEFRRPAYFVRLTEEVHTAMVEEQYVMLRRSEAVNRGFSDMLARGASVRQMVAWLAGLVDNPVVLEDAAHQVLEYAPQTSEVEEILGDWERHSRSEEGSQGVWPARRPPAATGNCFWQAITARGERWGRIHVLAVNRAIETLDAQAVDRAGAAIALAFAADREVRFLNNSAHSALLRDIDLGEFDTPTSIYRKAKALGADLSGRPLHIIALQPRNLAEWLSRDGNESVEDMRVLYGLSELLRASARSCDVQLLCAVQSDHVVGLIGVPAVGAPRQAADALGADFEARAQQRFPGLKVAIGASDDIHFDSSRRGFQEARDAMRWAVQDTNAPTVVYSQDLGLNRVLLKLAAGPDLASMVERELRPLLDYESRSGMPLIATLRSYIAANGRVNKAAKELCVERRTVYHRIRKVEQLINVDLQDADVWMRLYLALRGLDHLRIPRVPAQRVSGGALDNRR